MVEELKAEKIGSNLLSISSEIASCSHNIVQRGRNLFGADLCFPPDFCRLLVVP